MAMTCEECETQLWRAGEIAPPGIYMRADNMLAQPLVLKQADWLPASLDGHVALYRSAQPGCLCHTESCLVAPEHAAPHDDR